MVEALNLPSACLQAESILKRRRLSTLTTLILSILFILSAAFLPATAEAQDSGGDIEEISVYLAIQGIGGYDITAIYKDGVVYLPITEMLQSLKINYRISESGDTISGFFLEEKNKYYISKPGNAIFINGKLIPLSKDELINTENTSLALRIDQYGKLFGLDCRFDFSSLSVDLKTSQELPVIKELRLEQMRKNINRLRGEIVVDTTYNRKYHFFKGGMADWAIYSTQVANGPSDTRAMLGLGAEFLGGETDVLLNYSSRTGFDKNQQKYLWRWANNSTKLVKQVMVGTIPSKSISSIYSPLVGAVVTNAPLSYRRSFGTYTMSDFTEPGWTVELYINNVIVNYTTADARGFYTFDIPLVYGSSNVTLKFYGPWGEERSKEQIINVPYNFLPKGEVQYTVSGAMEQDTNHSIFSRTEVSYGLSRHVTLGGGFEYLSTVSSGPSIPFINGSAQILNNFLVYAEYAYNVRNKAIVSYSLPSGLSFEADWAKYTPGQTAIIYNYLEERKLMASIPINFKKIKIYSRVSYIQNILPESIYSSMEGTLSTYYKGVSANFTANANWLENSKAYIYGNLGLGFRFFNTLSVRPQAQYDFTNNQMIFTKLELENNFSPKVNLSLLWEDNFNSHVNSLELIFRYNFNFAQTSFSTRVSKNYFITSESAQGSIAFGSGNGRVIAGQTQQVGKAGLTIIPFLDINNNNHRDDNEPMTFGMNIRINGGRIVPSTKDSIIRIIDLEPFSSYMLEFSDSQFDNIAWQIPNKIISILMDPNQFKLLEVPIKVMGEINGMVYLKTGANLKGQGRVVVNIFNDEGFLVSKTQSESDGYFSYLGLAPGSYHAEIDSMQLVRLKSVSKPTRFDFEIQPSENGDIIDNLEFQLEKIVEETPVVVAQEIPKTDSITPTPKQEEVKEIKKEEIVPTVVVPPAVVAPPVVVTEAAKPVVKVEPVIPPAPIHITKEITESHGFFIQAGAFVNKSNAEKLLKELLALTPDKWFIVQENGFYKVRLGYFNTMEEAKAIESTLNSTGLAFYVNGLQTTITIDSIVQPFVAQPVAQDTKKDTLVPAQAARQTELGVEGKGYFIQAGAFRNKYNSEVLLKELKAQSPHNWFVVHENDYYKVRLGYFDTRKEAKLVKKDLKMPEVPFYLNKTKGYVYSAQESLQKPVVAIPDASISAKDTISQRAANVSIQATQNGFFIQAGAFKNKRNADKLLKDLLALSPNKWFMVYENGYYKVRLGYFKTKEEARNLELNLNIPDLTYYLNGTLDKEKYYPNAKIIERGVELPEMVETITVTDTIQKPVVAPAPVVEKTEIKVIVPKQEEVKPEKKDDVVTVVKIERQDTLKAAEKTIPVIKEAIVVTPTVDSTDITPEFYKFYIQAGAFQTKAKAEQLVGDLLDYTLKRWFIVFEDNLYKVQLGYFTSKEAAKFIAGTLYAPNVSFYVGGVRIDKQNNKK